MESEIQKYITGSELCHRITAPPHARNGLNMPLPPPPRPWEGLTLDFVNDLPESTSSGYTVILVIVDHLSNIANSLPCRKDFDSPEVARIYFEHVIFKCAVPDNITTNRGKEFISGFWDRVCYHLSINHGLLTPFHPQTDGQTERQNQIIEQCLRAFYNNEQGNWVELLPRAEFTYNISIHHSTLMTPFWANYNYHPTMQFNPPKDRSFRSQMQGDSWMTGMEETHRIQREDIIDAQERQTKYTGRMEMTFAVRDKVWPSTRNLKTSRPLKKLDYKCTAWYTVSKIINKNPYTLHFPNTMRNHNFFNVSGLDRYTPSVGGQPSSEPDTLMVEDTRE